MRKLIVFGVLLAMAHTVQAQPLDTSALDAEAKRIEIIRERIPTPHDPRLDEAERQLSRSGLNTLDLAAIDLLMLNRQWKDGSTFLEDRRFSR